MDIYSRDPAGLKPETVEGIKAALRAMGGDVERLAAELFEVVRDGEAENPRQNDADASAGGAGGGGGNNKRGESTWSKLWDSLSGGDG